MWIMTTGGFVSAVQHRDDASKLMVRARDRQSLATMVADMADVDDEAIYTEAGSDYRWRVVITKEQFKEFLSREVDDYLDYGNFKNKVTETLGTAWHDAYLKVWSTMLHSVPDNSPEAKAEAAIAAEERSYYESMTWDYPNDDDDDSMEDVYPEVAYRTIEVGDYVEIVNENEFVNIAAGERAIVKRVDGSGFYLVMKDEDTQDWNDGWMHADDLRKL